jgi:hypothetical protein
MDIYNNLIEEEAAAANEEEGKELKRIKMMNNIQDNITIYTNTSNTSNISTSTGNYNTINNTSIANTHTQDNTIPGGKRKRIIDGDLVEKNKLYL